MKRIKKIIPDRVSILTPPPYVPDQPIKIGVRRGALYPTPMSAKVLSASLTAITISFGGGRVEVLGLRLDGTAVESELTKRKRDST